MDSNETEPRERLETGGPVPVTPFEFDLNVAARLGAQAQGVALETIEPPENAAEGLPASIPVAFIRGNNPAVLDVSHLIEKYRQRPARKAGKAQALTFESFCDLTNRHKTDHSAIFANTDWQKPSFTTVIDYHENKSGGRAENGAHRILYNFPVSEEWKAWITLNGIQLKQADFANFLEDRIAELSSPTDHERITLEAQFATRIATPAQVVELSRGLAVHVDTKVRQAVTLQSGEGQIAWEETHNDAEGKALKVPGIFILSIAPFFRGDNVRIPVRLRYRTQGGSILWSYHIYRPDEAINQHVRDALAEARQKTALPAYEGAPEMSP